MPRTPSCGGGTSNITMSSAWSASTASRSPACTAAAQRSIERPDLGFVVSCRRTTPAGRETHRGSVAGSPNGVNRSASRNETTSATRSPRSGSTSSAARRRSASVASQQVRAERELPVRPGRQEPPAQRQRPVEQEAADRRRARGTRPAAAASSSARRRPASRRCASTSPASHAAAYRRASVAHRLVAEGRQRRPLACRRGRSPSTVRRARCRALLTAATRRVEQVGDLAGGEARAPRAAAAPPAAARTGAAARRRTPARRSPGPRGTPASVQPAVRVRLQPGRLGTAARPGRGRSAARARPRRSISVRHRLVAIRYSHGADRARGPRTVRAPARPARASPAPRPRRRAPTRASGSSAPAARRGTAGSARRTRRRRRPGRPPAPRHRPPLKYAARGGATHPRRPPHDLSPCRAAPRAAPSVPLN